MIGFVVHQLYESQTDFFSFNFSLSEIALLLKSTKKNLFPNVLKSTYVYYTKLNFHLLRKFDPISNMNFILVQAAHWAKIRKTCFNF